MLGASNITLLVKSRRTNIAGISYIEKPLAPRSVVLALRDERVERLGFNMLGHPLLMTGMG